MATTTPPAASGPPGFAQLLRGGDVRALLDRYSDIGLAALVVGIVAMMIVPLPTFLLDLFICLNIAIGVTLLLLAIYVNQALRIASFPTLLLITTLFRLALEVSATRLILLKADAGHVIAAFGNFVVSGNLVVGAVIFLILTMIQFIVIAKGSERVAEVGARFTLDAMPGKQMSIDAELRAGHIDHAEARRRRANLARESQFFGSMDGAMKFVKGDAIAGIIVLAVNIVGGLIIGILQRGMDPAQAARTYTILTIGEGLVAQIPALIISTAAGVIVTRVSSDEDNAHLGKEIAGQLLSQPKALAIAAAMLGLFALVPGLPAVPFLLLAVILGFAAYRLMRDTAAPAAGAVDVSETSARDDKTAPGQPLMPILAPVVVDVGEALARRLGLDTGASFGPAALAALRDRVFAETGIPLPPVRVRGAMSGVAPWGYQVRLQEVPMARGEVRPDAAMALGNPERLAEAGVAVLASTTHPDGTPAAWVEEGQTASLRLAGIAVLDAEEIVLSHLLTVLRRHGHELLGVQETQALLDGLERTHPALVREVVPKLVSPILLADVCKRLAEEGVSLRGMREILEALAQFAPAEKDPVALTEHVRGALRRQLTHRFAENGTLGVYLIEPLVEDTIREAIHKTALGSYLALEPELSRDIINAAQAAFGDARRPVVLTNAQIRRFVRRLLESARPDVVVLSYQELAPETQLQPLGQIAVSAG